jgi:hypothetical protein
VDQGNRHDLARLMRQTLEELTTITTGMQTNSPSNLVGAST